LAGVSAVENKSIGDCESEQGHSAGGFACEMRVKRSNQQLRKQNENTTTHIDYWIKAQGGKDNDDHGGMKRLRFVSRL
jgi:hypothetical protein